MHARLMISMAGLVLATALPADAQPRGRARGQTRAQTPIRFQEMDRNGDRVISRAEWEGSEASFRGHDWNRDGLLSGEEVRVGANPPARGQNRGDFDGADREYAFDDWTARGFTSLDRNRDGRIARDEWSFDRESFRRADHNGDGVVSRSEFLAEDGLDDDRGDRFVTLDTDRNGRLSRSEWHGAPQLFDALDTNRDGWVARGELLGSATPPELFSSVDSNRDGFIALNEWQWSRSSFDRLDLNHDNRVTSGEFNGRETTGTAGRSTAYTAGYERGRAEARAQALEDRSQNQGYDAEGQRELDTADSGYEPRVGAKTDYQAGYRAGWRIGYPEGWRERDRVAVPPNRL